MTLDKDIQGLIEEIWITGPLIKYKIAWWSGRTKLSDYFQEFQFTTQELKIKVGFHE